VSKRKKVIIDKKFQLKTTFSIIFIVIAVFAVLAAVVSGTAIYNNSKLEGAVFNQKQALSSQYEAFSALLVLSRQDNCTLEQINRAADEMANKIDRSQQMSNEIITSMESIIVWNYVLIFVIAAIVIIQCAVLFIVLIRKTHRIIGPAKLMAEQMDEIAAGGNPDIRPLREEDELKELYAAFARLAAYVKTIRR
jgi:nitrogen fixation/metabolism regulation signal transduction histidine kinase